MRESEGNMPLSAESILVEKEEAKRRRVRRVRQLGAE